MPSAPRSGNSISKGLPVAIEACHRSITLGSIARSIALRQPHPSICSGVVPVYSYQRWLYQEIAPSAPAIWASCGMPLAMA